MLKSVEESIFYHIYPLGFCGAMNKEESNESCKLKKINDEWITHLKEMGINAIYFGPLFESTYHGYDTIDYNKIDQRLGSDDDFIELVDKLHNNDIKVVVDGVFNHVGRDFWAFKDVRDKKEKSKYTSWFNIDFNRNSNYNDGFYYEGWEGNYDLVKLNLNNREVIEHLLKAIEKWVNEFKIDGIRLDVAYCIQESFLIELRRFSNNLKSDLWLMGEMIHGDYRRIVGIDKLHSATNYEVYKGMYSSHNDKNYFEIAYSLKRQFEEGGIYKNLDLYNFVDNHDVNRIVTNLRNKNYLNNVYTMLFTIPGIPSIYYGSEWGIEGDRTKTDLVLRPEIDIEEMKKNKQGEELVNKITKLINIRKNYKALTKGSYKEILVRNQQLVYGRCYGSEWVITALNLEDKDIEIEINVPCNCDKLIGVLNYNDEFSISNGKIKVVIPAFEGIILTNN